MIQPISEPVSVSFAYNHEEKRVSPRWISWNKRLYPVSKVGLHHTFRKGNTLYHVFSVVSKNSLFFRLVLNTENLHWELEHISQNT